MTNENQNLSEGQVKNLQSIVESEFNQKVIGANEIKLHPHSYGEIGTSVGESNYMSLVNSEDAQKIKAEEKARLEKEREELGIAESVPEPTNYYVVKKVKEAIGIAMQTLSLEKLVASMKKSISGFKLDIPESLKKYSIMSLMPKLSKKQELNKDEKYASGLIESVKENYVKILALKQTESGYIESVNAQMNAVVEEYKKAG